MWNAQLWLFVYNCLCIIVHIMLNQSKISNLPQEEKLKLMSTIHPVRLFMCKTLFDLEFIEMKVCFCLFNCFVFKRILFEWKGGGMVLNSVGCSYPNSISAFCKLKRINFAPGAYIYMCLYYIWPPKDLSNNRFFI